MKINGILRLLLICLMLGTTVANAQDWARLALYQPDNRELAVRPKKKGEKRVVFMGNSITSQWFRKRPEFFTGNGYVCRGIGGQTSSQMLLRFRQDVLNIGADVVVILAGTNDIAGNTGPVTLDMIVDNIAGMCDMARQNKIKVILCSVLPAKQYSWNKEVRPDLEIPKLNALLKTYACEQKIVFADYFSAMADPSPENYNGLPPALTTDGVHLTPEGYQILEKIITRYLK